MSTHIEFQQIVVRLPLEGHDFGSESADLAIAEAGDSNCSQFVTRGSREYEVQAKSWGAIALGTGNDAMRTIVQRAMDCEGGMLAFAARGTTLPETYIRRWRNAMSSPVTVHVARRCGLVIDAAVTLKRESFTSNYQLVAFDAIASSVAGEAVAEGIKFSFDLENPLQVNALLKAFRLLGSNAYAWRAVHVSGPREAQIHLAAA